MATRFSDVLGVEHNQLTEEGAFDAFVFIDSRLHVDPHLLRNVTTPELSESYERFRSYFDKIIRLLKQSKNRFDSLFRKARSLLTFKEFPFVSLGYSKSGSSGSGIGPGLARSLTDTAKEIIDAGIEDPIIFEIVGLIESGIGADRLSDMTIRVILPDLLAFSQRVASNLGIETREYTLYEENYDLPYSNSLNRPFVLIPQEILRDLPVAFDWEDIDIVCGHNEMLRKAVNDIIGTTWKEATRKLHKEDLKANLLKRPMVLRDLINQYSSKDKSPYNFEKDPLGLFVWDKAADEYTEKYPLDLPSIEEYTPENILKIVKIICERFKKLIEDNGLNKVLYDENKNPRHERSAQLLFFAIADSYCKANNLDLTGESDAGRGPVDFKLSRGSRAKITVEIKLSTNTQLVHGFETQLPIYNKAEESQYSIFLIIQTNRGLKRIREVQRIQREEVNAGNKVPEIIIVDGRLKPSASKA